MKMVEEEIHWWKLSNERGIKSYVPIKSGKLLLQYWENIVGWFNSIYENGGRRKFINENWKLPYEKGIKSSVPIRSGKLLLQ